MYRVFIINVLLILILSCQQKEPETLPVIGDRIGLDGDTIVHFIRPFTFTDQLGNDVTNATYKDLIHVVDFFFTSCPSICPKVTAQMLRIYDHVKEDGDVRLISHTIDPKRDSISVLKRYADNLEIDHGIWHFLRGPKDEIMDIANEDYFIAALEAPDAPGGFDHSGKIILLDKSAKIRAFCDGTDPESVSEFIRDIDKLKKSYE